MDLEGVKLAREVIGLFLATEQHSARLFAKPYPFLEHPPPCRVNRLVVGLYLRFLTV